MKKGFLILGVLCLLLLAGCTSRKETDQPADGRMPVVASFYAMKELTESIGGDKVRVTVLIPEGTEPHDFQPTTKSMKALSRARVFVRQGLGMEPWAEEMVRAAENKKMVQVVASRDVEPIRNEDAEDYIREIAQYLREHRRPQASELRQDVLHMTACRAARGLRPERSRGSMTSFSACGRP